MYRSLRIKLKLECSLRPGRENYARTSRGLSDKNRHLMSLIVGTFILQSHVFPNHGNALQQRIYALAIPHSSGRIKSLPTFTQSGPSRPPRHLELWYIDTIPLFMIHILDIISG